MVAGQMAPQMQQHQQGFIGKTGKHLFSRSLIVILYGNTICIKLFVIIFKMYFQIVFD